MLTYANVMDSYFVTISKKWLYWTFMLTYGNAMDSYHVTISNN